MPTINTWLLINRLLSEQMLNAVHSFDDLGYFSWILVSLFHNVLSVLFLFLLKSFLLEAFHCHILHNPSNKISSLFLPTNVFYYYNFNEIVNETIICKRIFELAKIAQRPRRFWFFPTHERKFDQNCVTNEIVFLIKLLHWISYPTLLAYNERMNERTYFLPAANEAEEIFFTSIFMLPLARHLKNFIPQHFLADAALKIRLFNARLWQLRKAFSMTIGDNKIFRKGDLSMLHFIYDWKLKKKSEVVQSFNRNVELWASTRQIFLEAWRHSQTHRETFHFQFDNLIYIDLQVVQIQFSSKKIVNCYGYDNLEIQI